MSFKNLKYKKWFRKDYFYYSFPFIFLLGLTLLFSGDFKRPSFFPIKTVKIYGLKEISKAETKDLLLPEIINGFFMIKVDRIKEKLKQIPWVSDVNVRRSWPDQLEVMVIERNPVAIWNHTTLLSDAGEVFRPTKVFKKSLPYLAGPIGKQRLILNYFNEINRLLEPLHARIGCLELLPSLTWKLQLDNGVNFKMGHKETLTRLSHFVKVYPKIIDHRESDVDYIDLRYSNGVAVRWKNKLNV